MKNKKILEAIGNIDEKYVEEARPTGVKKKSILLKLGAMAACICLIVGASLALFTPYSTSPPDVSEYSSSEYYSVIQKLNEATFEKPYYANAFESIIGSVSNLFELLFAGAKGEAPEDAGPSAAPEESYQEVTDNQVNGVIEADIIKRSDKHIYYLRKGRLDVYSIAGEESGILGSYPIEGAVGNCTMYLSEDAKTLTLLSNVYDIGSRTVVKVTSLDVSAPNNITLKNEFTITGSYLSSRKVGDRILLISEFYTRRENDFSDPSSFVPSYNKNGVENLIPAESIISPDKLSTTRYTVVTCLNEGELELIGCEAFLSYNECVYVSQDNIFVTRRYNESSTSENLRHNRTMTEISVMSYSSDTLTYKGSVTVNGYIKDQYSLDELDGILRVVTTTSESIGYISSDRSNTSLQITDLDESNVAPAGTRTSASLYCIDLSSLVVVASVEEFAPLGETVRSVRFDGNAAYVCTSYMIQDPVFFFDLSDLDNITYKDTGTIQGFSTSLIQLGDGFLLGVGIDGWNSVKIEIYEQGETGVVSVCSYKVDSAYYSENYKSYFIDRERDLFGLGIVDMGVPRYVLLHFDGYELREALSIQLDGEVSTMRAVLIDGYFYMLSDVDFEVVSIQ